MDGLSYRQAIVLLGTGLFAEELADLAAEMEDVHVVACVENLDREKAGRSVVGHRVVWIDDLPSLPGVRAVTAITSTDRERYVEQVRDLGVPFGRLVHPRSILARSVTLGDDVVVGASVVVGAQTTVGDHVILNRGALIGHHVELQDLSTVQPGAIIGGACTIERRAYVGLGARVLERLRVGAGAVVAAGAVVTRDVEPNTVVMGVPARVVRSGVVGRST
jgi:sugar O-acyltransferase (sialic acid O-acetyltransferase NeuD family)